MEHQTRKRRKSTKHKLTRSQEARCRVIIEATAKAYGIPLTVFMSHRANYNTLPAARQEAMRRVIADTPEITVEEAARLFHRHPRRMRFTLLFFEDRRIRFHGECPRCHEDKNRAYYDIGHGPLCGYCLVKDVKRGRVLISQATKAAQFADALVGELFGP